jgi:DNA-binding CsgD family transcriptional regulator
MLGVDLGLALHQQPRPPSWWAMSPVTTTAACERFAREQALSTREREVINLALQELHTKEIAHRLGCAPSTIDEYWKRIYRKTGAGSKLAVLSRLLIRALCWGMEGGDRPAGSSMTNSTHESAHHRPGQLYVPAPPTGRGW